jgi:hypothetical protein
MPGDGCPIITEQKQQRISCSVLYFPRLFGAKENFHIPCWT